MTVEAQFLTVRVTVDAQFLTVTSSLLVKNIWVLGGSHLRQHVGDGPTSVDKLSALNKKIWSERDMKSAFNVILFFLIIILIVSAVRPFWAKYRLGEEIEVAAIYGTKNSIEDIKKFLTQKMKESGRDFAGDDFFIEKNEHNTVTISITYEDRIGFFGVSLKTLEITLEETVHEVKELF